MNRPTQRRSILNTITILKEEIDKLKTLLKDASYPDAVVWLHREERLENAILELKDLLASLGLDDEKPDDTTRPVC